MAQFVQTPSPWAIKKGKKLKTFKCRVTEDFLTVARRAAHAQGIGLSQFFRETLEREIQFRLSKGEEK